MLALFSLLVLSASACSWTGTANDGKSYKYDLSGMTKKSGYYGTTYSGYSFEMNVCDYARVANPKCNAYSASLCQTELGQEGGTSYVLAAYNATFQPSWAFIDAADPTKGVKQIFNNGEVCFGKVNPRSVTVNYYCNAAASDTFTIVETAPSSCIYNVDIQSPCACVGGCSSGSDSSSGLSGGWVFIIILVVVIPVYVGVGCIYKTTKQGTSGIESCPNIEFWKDFPLYVKDGFAFTMRGCKKQGDSYDAL